jgi:hypothetical protein
MNKKLLRRIDSNITEKEYRFLIEEAERTGLSVSEILRRAIDKYFEKEKFDESFL